MKKLIEYYYKISIKHIIKKNNEYYIDDIFLNKYILTEIKKINIDILYATQNIKEFHSILVNKDRNIITQYENKTYTLMKVNINENKKITLNDLISILQKLNSKRIIGTPNIEGKWKEKVDMFEKYISTKNRSILLNREYYDYYIGISENAIKYIKNVNYNFPITYGASYKKIKNNDTLYDLYNPFNLVVDPIVFSIAEYIKILKKINIEYIFETIETLELTYNDYILLISALMYPKKFYNLFTTDINDENRIKEFKVLYTSSQVIENYIKEIYNYIKKRHTNMPTIGWLM